MKWSWRIITVAGIGVYVHVTFFLLLIWIGWANFSVRHVWNDAFKGIAFILALFLIVLLHEFGHAMTARRFGIRTRDITLLPIGGLARLERMPEDPRQELAVALAGPAVNVLLAALCLAVLAMQHQIAGFSMASLTRGSFVGQMLMVNVILAVFNLLPAFPMDGGRVLRALLAIRMSYPKATRVAAGIGQAMAFLFGFVGLFTNPLLILIALFVWIGASQESGMVQMKSALGGIPVSQVMITDFKSLAVHDPLSRAVSFLLAGYQQDFPVTNDDGTAVLGLLTRQALVAGLAQGGENTAVGDCMEQNFEATNPAEMADAAFARLQNCNCRSLPVVRDGRLEGILTRENIGEFLMIQAALHHEPGVAQAGFRLAGRPAA